MSARNVEFCRAVGPGFRPCACVCVRVSVRVSVCVLAGAGGGWEAEKGENPPLLPSSTVLLSSEPL